MGCKNCGSNGEILRLLQNLTQELSQVKTDCRRIKKEILGISEEAELDPEGLMETSTVRQVMEKMAFDIEQLQEREKERLTLKEENESLQSMVREELRDAEKRKMILKIKDIEPRTVEEEQKQLRAEMKIIVESRQLVDGPSFPPGQSNFTLNLQAEIQNFLDVPLSGFKHFIPKFCKSSIATSASNIPAGSKQRLSYSSSDEWGRIKLFLSYQIERSRLRLVIWVSVDRVSAHLRVALVPSDISINEEMGERFFKLGKDNSCSSRSDIATSGRDGRGGALFVKCGNIRVMAQLMTNGIVTWSQRLKVYIGAIEGSREERFATSKHAKHLKMLDRISQNIGLASSVYEAALGSIAQDYGLLVILGNGLRIDLTDPLVYFPTEDQVVCPDAVASFSAGSLQIRGTSFLEGVITYHIADTDLRIALAFKQNTQGNLFGFGLIPFGTPVDKFLLQSLLEKDITSWETRTDQKIAEAGDGPQVISQRNIIARAKMTSETKAVLEMFVTSY